MRGKQIVRFSKWMDGYKGKRADTQTDKQSGDENNKPGERTQNPLAMARRWKPNRGNKDTTQHNSHDCFLLSKSNAALPI